jgi:transcriptional regulator with XRE-family HTH domain
MLIQERIQLILKMHNLTPSAFADRIGVQRSALSHVLTGRNKPGLDFLEKILVNFPRVNAHWLITGVVSQGETKMEQSTLEVIEEKSSEKISSPVQIVMFFSDGTFKAFEPNAE